MSLNPVTSHATGNDYRSIFQSTGDLLDWSLGAGPAGQLQSRQPMRP